MTSSNDPSTRAASAPTPSSLSRMRAWLGLERNIVVMLVAFLVLGMGEELWVRFVPKYLELLGAGAAGIAAYGALKDLLDALYTYPGGWLSDHLGRRIALVLFALLAAAGYAIYLISPTWLWVLAGTLLVMAWSSLTLPAIFSVIGDNLPTARRGIGFGVQSILKRIPIVLAPPLGGLMIASLGLGNGFRLGLAITLGLALASAWLLWRYYDEPAPAAPSPIRFAEVWRRMDIRLKRLLIADCLARWAEGIPRVFIILYVINVLGADALQFGWLTSLQMLAAILVYIPIAKLSDRLNRKPFVLLTFAFFALFPLTLGLAAGLTGLIVAFVIAGLREIGEPARKALIVDLSGEIFRGQAVGMYYLIRGLVVFPASLVGGLLWAQQVRLPFFTAFLVGIAGLVWYAARGPGEDPTEAEPMRS